MFVFILQATASHLEGSVLHKDNVVRTDTLTQMHIKIKTLFQSILAMQCLVFPGLQQYVESYGAKHNKTLLSAVET